MMNSDKNFQLSDWHHWGWASITKELMERLSYYYSNLNRLKGINKFQPVVQVIMLIKLSF